MAKGPSGTARRTGRGKAGASLDGSRRGTGSGAAPRPAAKSAGNRTQGQTARGIADPAEPEASRADQIHLVLTWIPRGTVTTYGRIAELAGLPRQARLVGRMLSALPARSRLPWHRVLNASLTISPRGDPLGQAEQRRRLEREGVRFKGNRVMRDYLWTP